MSNKTITIRVSTKDYENYDDSLLAAAEDAAEEFGLDGWDLNPRWDGENRDAILMDIPAWAAKGAIPNQRRTEP